MTLLNAEKATYKYPDWSSSRPGHRLMIIKNQSHQVISAIGTVAFLIAYGPFSYCLFDNPFTGCKWSLLAASLIHWPEDLWRIGPIYTEQLVHANHCTLLETLTLWRGKTYITCIDAPYFSIPFGGWNSHWTATSTKKQTMQRSTESPTSFLSGHQQPPIFLFSALRTKNKESWTAWINSCRTWNSSYTTCWTYNIRSTS